MHLVPIYHFTFIATARKSLFTFTFLRHYSDQRITKQIKLVSPAGDMHGLQANLGKFTLSESRMANLSEPAW